LEEEQIVVYLARFRKATLDSLQKKTYDAVVVGSGSTGGWACKTLTEAGMSVLLLEIGEHPDDIPLGHGPERVVLPRKKYFATEEEFPYATDSSPSFRWHRVLKYGGRSIYWNRISLRLSNFEMKAATLDGYGLDWPVDENELAPFYSEAEKFFGVHGERDGIPQLPDGDFLPRPPFLPADETFRKTMEEHFSPSRKSLKGLRVTIVGDIAHSRVARSNIHLLQKLAGSYCCPGSKIQLHHRMFFSSVVTTQGSPNN
jgi:choline dehydrogenase-like flavoprotein